MQQPSICNTLFSYVALCKCGTVVLCTLLPACTTPPTTPTATSTPTSAATSVEASLPDAIRAHALPINTADLSALDSVLASAQVVGLGEATHGQQEAFAFKRALTMHLIRHHNYRTVAYESSATRARLCDDYINARTDSLNDAMRGLGMMIWRVEENAQLLRDLRAWNMSAAPQDRVRFIGVDVQDPAAAADRLAQLITSADAPASTTLAESLRAIPPRIEPAIHSLYSTGDPTAFNQVVESLTPLMEAVCTLAASGKLNPADSQEAKLRATELRWGIEMFRTAGGRDRAMGQMLIDQIEPDERAVFWAHNEHIKKGPLTYLNTDELAAGGHIAFALGDRYHALGVIFHAGDFHSLAQDPAGSWLFRSYIITPDMAANINGNISAPFIEADLGPSLLPLNIDAASSTLQTWLNTAHPMLWFGGYRVPDDLKAHLAQHPPISTTPKTDYDSIAYWQTTTASTLFDKR
jgi:erythromycin esterase